MHEHKDVYSTIFSAELFIAAKEWEQPNINQGLSIYTSLLNTFYTKEYYAAIKTNEVELSVQIGNNLQDLVKRASCRSEGWKIKR